MTKNKNLVSPSVCESNIISFEYYKSLQAQTKRRARKRHHWQLHVMLRVMHTFTAPCYRTDNVSSTREWTVSALNRTRKYLPSAPSPLPRTPSCDAEIGHLRGMGDEYSGDQAVLPRLRENTGGEVNWSNNFLRQFTRRERGVHLVYSHVGRQNTSRSLPRNQEFHETLSNEISSWFFENSHKILYNFCNELIVSIFYERHTILILKTKRGNR